MADQSIDQLQEQMHELFARAKLPTSPAIASKILGLIDRHDSTARQFAELIEADPALAARLLKMANSAQYAQRNVVTTIQRAITVLGNRQLRVIVLGFELVGHLDQLGDCPFDLKAFWQQSVLRGCVARAAATRVVPSLAEEAFLIGLLVDSGILPLVQVLGQPYASLCADRGLSPSAFVAKEREGFPFTHCDAIGVLARMWHLPESIAAPLATHHEPIEIGEHSPDPVRLAGVIYFASSLKLDGERVREAPGDHTPLVYARRALQLNETELAAIFATAREAFERMAPLFEDRLPVDHDVTTLLTEANRHLLETAYETEGRVREAEEERDRILDEHVTLRTALGQYREQAARDPLTGLLNRRALLDSLELLPDEQARSVTLMFLDIDNFKVFNDHYGHHVGDAVLKMTADTVRMIAGERGLAARYGGEEFIAVLTDLNEEQAHRLAEELVEAIRDTCVPGLELPSAVTASVGAVWCRIEHAPSLPSLIAIADELMYTAKRGGKDHACFRSLEDPDVVTALGCQAGCRAHEIEASPAGISQELFREVATRMEAGQTVRAADNRKQTRRGAESACVINYFFPPSRRMLKSDGFVRSMSTGGIGLLTGRSLARGDLIEVELRHDGRPLFVAGLVAFSRHIEGPIHEVGVQLFQSAHRPVLSHDPESALQDLEWAAEAMDSARDTRDVA